MQLFRASDANRSKFALERGLNESTIRTWEKQEAKLQQLPISKVKSVRYITTRKGHFVSLEKAVMEWVSERNEMGLRVKDSSIIEQGLHVKQAMLSTMPEGAEKEKLSGFGASRIWCHRFKKRNNLTSRRHTTTHKLPYGFQDIAINFINRVHETCSSFKIPRERIFNFDQVSRYFENDRGITLAKKGAKEILLRKSNQGHKKFTFTPFVTASGKFIMKHSLFSKLKNAPKVDARTKVDVNKTAMWSMEIIKKRLDEAVKICRGLFSSRSNVLVLLDSYPAHVKFVKENLESYSENSVHMLLIPPNLTGLLQPLDVALNRSFQQFFNEKTDAYMSKYFIKLTSFSFSFIKNKLFFR